MRIVRSPTAALVGDSGAADFGGGSREFFEFTGSIARCTMRPKGSEPSDIHAEHRGPVAHATGSRPDQFLTRRNDYQSAG